MEIKEEILGLARKAKTASGELQHSSTDLKNRALHLMADNLMSYADRILSENEEDIKKARRQKVSPGFLDRLHIGESGIEKMARSLRDIAALRDPVGEVISMWRRPNGLRIGKVRVPLGVIGIIYESRPDVTCECTGLCLKSGNAVILKGGREALRSNIAIYEALSEAAYSGGIPQGSIALVTSTARKGVQAMLGLSEYIDLIIPRGGEGLINMVSERSRIPVIRHYKGVCHVYVDEDADLNMATKITINAKVQRPGVCKAMETLLVHKDIAGRFLPGIVKALKDKGVEIRGCEKTRKIVKGLKRAIQKDWAQEYLDLILSVKVVEDIDEAVEHINTYGSSHSDAIVTDNYSSAAEFLEKVDSACVYVNASTRFTDGGEFGMGAEIGISTDKLHARGPMSLTELTSYKYIILGNGQIREG